MLGPTVVLAGVPPWLLSCTNWTSPLGCSEPLTQLALPPSIFHASKTSSGISMLNAAAASGPAGAGGGRGRGRGRRLAGDQLRDGVVAGAALQREHLGRGERPAGREGRRRGRDGRRGGGRDGRLLDRGVGVLIGDALLNPLSVPCRKRSSVRPCGRRGRGARPRRIRLPSAALLGVVAPAAGQRVRARPAGQHVVAAVAVEAVVAVAAVQRVVAAAAGEPVGARVAEDRVVAAAAAITSSPPSPQITSSRRVPRSRSGPVGAGDRAAARLAR